MIENRTLKKMQSTRDKKREDEKGNKKQTDPGEWQGKGNGWSR